MAYTEGEPEEVRIGSQDLEWSSELLAQFLLVTGRRQRRPPGRRELVPQFVEEFLRQRLKEIVAVLEVLVERCTSDTGPSGDDARGEPTFAARQDQSTSGIEQPLTGSPLGFSPRDGRGRRGQLSLTPPVGSGSSGRHRENGSKCGWKRFLS